MMRAGRVLSFGAERESQVYRLAEQLRKMMPENHASNILQERLVATYKDAISESQVRHRDG
jgi:hypothetical protein